MVHYSSALTPQAAGAHRSGYPAFQNDSDAIKFSIKPQVSGTFRGGDPYAAKNNAAVGLYISSNIVRKLRAEMFIISGHGLLHISPRDVTHKELQQSWPGTLVLVNLGLSHDVGASLQQMMSEFRESASRELETS